MDAIKTVSHTISSTKLQQIGKGLSATTDEDSSIAGHKAYVFRNICIKIGYAIGGYLQNTRAYTEETNKAMPATDQTLTVDIIHPDATPLDVIKAVIARVPEKERAAFIRTLKKSI